MLQLIVQRLSLFRSVFWDLRHEVVDLRASRDRRFARVDDADAEIRGSARGVAAVSGRAVDVEVDAEGIVGRRWEGKGWRFVAVVGRDEVEEAEDVGVGSVEAGFDQWSKGQLLG